MNTKEKIKRAKEYCQREGIPEGNPELLYLIFGELRTVSFRLAVLIGTNAVLVALLLAILLGR